MRVKGQVEGGGGGSRWRREEWGAVERSRWEGGACGRWEQEGEQVGGGSRWEEGAGGRWEQKGGAGGRREQVQERCIGVARSSDKMVDGIHGTRVVGSGS